MAAAARAGRDPAALARAFLEGGARCIQLRAKDLPSDRFLDLCDVVVRAAVDCEALVIVNDRVDLAQMSGAGGVHVGQEDLPPSVARALLGEDAVVGCSTHTEAQLERAAAEPVSYIAVGPVFFTSTKDTGYDAVGLEMVSLAASRARGRPIVAIGGVTLDKVPALLAAGAASVAVIGDLMTGDDPARRIAAYVQALRDAGPSERR